MSILQPPPLPSYPYGYPMTGPRFGLGAVLGTGLKVWVKNLVPFALIAAVLLIPHVLWSRYLYTHIEDIVQGETTKEGGQMAMLKAMFPTWILREALTVLMCSCVTYGVVMSLQGERVGVVKALGRGIARFLPTLGVALLVLLCNFGGLVMLVIPGLMAWCTLYVTVPASVIEKPGLFGALKRSAELTKGHRMELFALGVILVMSNTVLNAIVGAIVAPHAGSENQADLRLALDVELPRLAWVEYGQNILFVSLSAVFASVTYYLLRAEKEGTSAHELGKVFA